MFTFNLTDEKWLPCVMTDKTSRDLSLREVLLEAANAKEIIGDSPPVTIALHRLLLAILHRALKAPQTADEWNEIREAGEFDRRKLENYFDTWKARFDLFDEKFPFYQSVSARENVQDGAIIQLYFQGKNNATLFDHSTINAPNSLSPAEAARYLIAFQGFDFGGIKADGSAQTAPLLQSAIALVKGENLFKTLLFNLHRYDGEQNPFPFDFSEDLPAWERDEETEAVERLPDGYVDLLTWQARRIFLQPEQTADGATIVKNSVIMRGYAMPKTVGRHAKETMTAFRASKTEGFFPVGFSETRALWRNSMSLLQTVAGEKNRPMMLDWLNDLVQAGKLSRADALPVDFYGLAADKGKLLFWQQESFDLPLAYLNDENLLESLKTALEFAEEISGNLRSAVKKLAETLETNAANFPATPIYWSTLELKFQSLLSDLPNDKDAATRRWFAEVLAVANRAFDQTANSLSGSAQELKAAVEARGLFDGITYKTKQKLEYKNFVPEIFSLRT
ncbi:MAG TPA: type I-E CRISPR-associated protein Cse1/CasA [Pyrinomonadaceae bacterium]|nr:type I-E CRISPR-associated protein Cse1/CasA [Pyrinomonadaceae bacterium]